MSLTDIYRMNPYSFDQCERTMTKKDNFRKKGVQRKYRGSGKGDKDKEIENNILIGNVGDKGISRASNC